jgi:hypothetical protein
MAKKPQPRRNDISKNKTKRSLPIAGSKSEQPFASVDERMLELKQTAEAVSKLALDESAFSRTFEAFNANNAEAFRAELSRIGIIHWCRLICHFFCWRRCTKVCRIVCKQFPEFEPNIAELREFAGIMSSIAVDDALLKKLLDAVDREDVKAFEALLRRYKWGRFCFLICHWLCSVRCQRICSIFCPAPPLITHIENIPTSQIAQSGTGIGLGAGPSVPPGTTSSDNPTGGMGDHPFGGLANIRGVFNVTGAFQYKVEYAPAPAGPWTPILTSIPDQIWNGTQFVDAPRLPTGSDGWYNVADMHLLGQNYLTDFPTPPDRNKAYYLRLTVRNSAMTEFASPVVAMRVDNGSPAQPIIDLQLRAPDGTMQMLGCCDKISRGNGNLLAITITATDENFSSISVVLEGGCGVVTSIVDTGGTPLSKTYNGNLGDTGYPVATTFLWDPWAAGIDKCCYLIEVSINDRAIVNNYYSGGHSASNFRSITIA